MPPRLDFDSLHLPILVFSRSLTLSHANPAARRIFGQAGPTSEPLPASWFFRERSRSTRLAHKGLAHEEDSMMSEREEDSDGSEDLRGEAEDPQAELRKELEVFARESQMFNWGESSTLSYWTGPEAARTAHRAAATVQRLQSPTHPSSTAEDDDDGDAETFIITLLRPITASNSSLRPLLSSATSFTSSTGESLAGGSTAGDPAASKESLTTILSGYVENGLPKKETIVDELPQMEYRVLGADQTWRWFVARGVALRNADGAITGWIAALTDVEDLARSEAVTVRTHVRAVLAGAAFEAPPLPPDTTFIGTNVTDRVAADELVESSKRERAELVASEKASREASRLKTEFAANLSHEIRTPLASVMGICELLLLQSLEKEHRVLVEQCLRCGEILLDLVGSILDFGKIESGQLKLEKAPLRIADLLRDANLFSFNARKRGLTFEQVNVNPLYEGELLGDRLRFSQILANALSNAVKFTSVGGIIFRVEQAAESPSQVLLTFVIEDSGCGIPPHVLPTLFQPFKQADASTARTFGGSGLGLVIAKNLVKLFEGTITLESTVGVGSTVTIHIPMTKAPKAPINSLPPLLLKKPASRPSRRPEIVHILVADDCTDRIGG
ncbi:hypothetical protein RQP46_000657 [Phenoliferia psychrophenolica]